MLGSLTITKKHETYYRDALIFGVIGFVAAFIYYFLYQFSELVISGYMMFVFVIVAIQKLRAQFKPESFQFKPEQDKISVWRRSEFNDNQPYERLYLAHEQVNDGVTIKTKDFGTSAIKTEFFLDKANYGEENLNRLCDYLDGLNNTEKNNPANNVRLSYQKAAIPSELVGYLVTIAMFFCINVFLNEDPQKYTYLHAIISPVDYEVTIPLNSLSIEEIEKLENKISAYEVDRHKVDKMFPKRHVSIKDFKDSLQITHKIIEQEGKAHSLTLEFSSAYDEEKLKYVYNFIAKDIQAGI